MGSRFLRKIESPSLTKFEMLVRYPSGEIGGTKRPQVSSVAVPLRPISVHQRPWAMIRPPPLPGGKSDRGCGTSQKMFGHFCTLVFLFMDLPSPLSYLLCLYPF